MVWSEGEWKVTTTAIAFTQHLSTLQKKMEKVVAEYRDISTSPTWVHLHY